MRLYCQGFDLGLQGEGSGKGKVTVSWGFGMFTLEYGLYVGCGLLG